MMGKIPPVPGAERTARPAAPEAGTGSARRLTPVALAITLTTALALFLRLWQLTKHGYLLGVTEYDDGVYFGGAMRLIHGAVPYKDFVTVQPPGVMLLMTPAALFAGPFGTAKALFLGRVLTACAGAAGVTLTGLLIRHRGALAVAVAGGFLAVYPDGVYAAHTVLIEPWLVLFCLAGALAVLDGDHLTGSGRRLAAGGVAFGFAGVCKAWAIFPVTVLLILLLLPGPAGLGRSLRRAAVFLGGIVAGFALPVLPFAVLAPRAFYTSVIVAQWARTDDVRIPTSFRVASMIGLSHGPDLPHLLLAAVAAAIAAVAAGSSLLATVISQRWPPPLEIFVLITAALIVLAFVWPPDYYYHYGAFLGPFLALSVVLPVDRLAEAVRQRRPVAETAQRTAPRTATGAGYRLGLAATAVIVLMLAVLQARTAPDPELHGIADAVFADEQIIPPGSCVLADSVSYTIAANRFYSTEPGCPIMVDSIGTDYALSHGENAVSGAGNTPAVQRVWLSALSRAQFVWLSGLWERRMPWTPPIASYFNAHFRLVRADAAGRVYQRGGHSDGEP
jgi:alpha-1,2-mannosyltransferase